MSVKLINWEESVVRGEMSKFYPKDGRITGQTGFFRYQDFYQKLISHLANLDKEVSILSVGGSIGCEIYSLSMLANLKFKGKPCPIKFYSVDLSEQFTEIAQAGVFPLAAIENLKEKYSEFFKVDTQSELASITDDVLNNVEILPAQDIRDMKLSNQFDVVIALNVIQHYPWITEDGDITLDETKSIVKALGELSRDKLVLNMLHRSAFDPARTLYKGNLFEEMGYESVLDRQFKAKPINFLKNPLMRNGISFPTPTLKDRILVFFR